MRSHQQAASPRAAARPPGPAAPRRVATPPGWTRLALRAGLSKPGDADERMAERAADAVRNGLPVGDVGRSTAVPLHRACAACDGAGADPARAPLVPTGGGRPLAAAARSPLEASFGRSLQSVRVHEGPAAARGARELGARAYAVGQDIVLGAGQPAADTSAGRELLAHEVAHVLQGGAALRRSVAASEGGAETAAGIDERSPPISGSAPPPASAAGRPEAPQVCPPPAELACEPARDSPGDVRDTVHFGQGSHALAPADRSRIAAVALAWRGLPQTVTVRVDGYASAEGDCDYNWRLSCLRAQAVAAELAAPAGATEGVASASLQVVAHGESDEQAAALGPNRRATISLPLPLPQDSSDDGVCELPPALCGPDATQWLVGQMNANRNHPVIRTAREVDWPNYIPFFNLGWTYGYLSDFRDLVRAGAPWDFKSNQDDWRAGAGKSCPSIDCDRTV